MAAVDPFAAYDTVVAPAAPAVPANSNPAPGGGPAVSQQLIPQYDQQGRFIGASRAPDTPGGAAPANDQGPSYIQPPVDEKRNLEETYKNLLGEPLGPLPAGQTVTPSAPVAAKPVEVSGAKEVPKPAAKAGTKQADPFAAYDHLVQPTTTTPVAAATSGTATPIPAEPAKGGGVGTNLAAGFLEGVGGAGDIVTHPIISAVNLGLKQAGLPEIPSNSETMQKIIDLVTPPAQGKGEELARAAGRGVGATVMPAAVASRVASAAGAAAPAILKNLAASGGPGGILSGALGGATGEELKSVVPDQYKPIAEMAGNFAGAGVGSGVAAVGNAAGRAGGSLFRRASVPDRVVGNVLLDTTGGKVPTFETAPTPGAPLNVAQASGNPELASLVDLRDAADVPAMKREVTGQNTALMNQAPRSGTSSLHALEVAAERASTAATGLVKKAERISNTEEKRVWNTPALTQPNVSTSTAKQMVAKEMVDMRANESGLALAIDDSGALRRTIGELTAMPDKAAANQINAISSRFRKIARDPSESSDVRLVAQRLGNRTQEGIWSAPEVAGVPAQHIPATTETHIMPDGHPEVVQIAARNIPGTPADPILVRDLKAAREFTKREAETFGHASFDNILNRNSRGNETVVPGTALNRFFDFGSGSERPGAIKNVVRFMDDIRSEWMKLNNSDGTYDHAMVDQVRNDLKQNAQDFIIAKMLGRVAGTSIDMTGERVIQAAQLNKWLSTNKPMIERSGLFDANQLAALDAMQKTGEMIQRGRELGKPVNSATYTRLTGEKKWLDVFMGPLTAAVSGAAIGGILGATLGHIVGEGPLGAILGAETAAGGGLGGAVLSRLYSAPREAVLKKLDEAIRNPEIAKDLMEKAASKRKMSAATKLWMRSFLSLPPANNGAAQ